MAEITIRVREQIPYTKEFCEVARQTAHEAFCTAKYDIAGETIRMMLEQVSQCVDEKMGMRRSAPGPFGSFFTTGGE